MIDVMFYEVFKEEEEALSRYLSSDIRAKFACETIQKHGSSGCLAPLISIRTQSRIPDAWAKMLTGILTRSTGYDHIKKYIKRTKTHIPCGYLPAYCSRAVAEHAMMAALALLRKFKTQLRSVNEFKRDDLTGRECQNRNMLIVGVGNIGQQVLDIAQGLRMNTLGVDIDPKTDEVAYVSLEEGVPWADIIICAVPLTAETHNMLNYNRLQHARRGVILVNIARGEITPTADLKCLLKEGVLGGLSLDVYEKESLVAECARTGRTVDDPVVKDIAELKQKDNVIFTPHNAFNTEESVERKAQQSAEAIVSFLKNKQFPSSVPEE